MDTPTVKPTGLSYKTICKIDTSKYTELQLKAYADSFRGAPLYGWTGYVYDASERMVQIAMVPKEEALFWTGNVQLLGIPLALASQLQVGHQVGFSGRIREVGVFWGSICNPLVIEEAQIQ